MPSCGAPSPLGSLHEGTICCAKISGSMPGVVLWQWLGAGDEMYGMLLDAKSCALGRNVRCSRGPNHSIQKGSAGAASGAGAMIYKNCAASVVDGP